MASLTYKGYPLVRKQNELYFGNMSDDFVVWMQIQQSEKKNGLSCATKVRLYLMSTELKANPMECISKTAERESLFEALDLADAWLSRA